MKSKKWACDKTELWGTPLLIALGEGQWPSTTASIKLPEEKLEIKTQKEEQMMAVWRSKLCAWFYQKLLIYLPQQKNFTKILEGGWP